MLQKLFIIITKFTGCCILFLNFFTFEGLLKGTKCAPSPRQPATHRPDPENPAKSPTDAVHGEYHPPDSAPRRPDDDSQALPHPQHAGSTYENKSHRRAPCPSPRWAIDQDWHQYPATPTDSPLETIW